MLSRRKWFCGKDVEFSLGCVELVLPLGGQMGNICRAAGSVVCS